MAAAVHAGLVLGQRPTGRVVVKVAVANYEPIFLTTNGGVNCGAPYWQVCGWTAPSQVVFNVGILFARIIKRVY
jgi:hypothetical protein